MIQGLYFTSNSIKLKEEITWHKLTPPINDSDVYYHDFIVKMEDFRNTKAFIIECKFNEEQKGLSLATHLRFTGFTQPIYVIGEESKDDLRHKVPNSILNTELINYEDINDLDNLSIVYENTIESEIKDAIKSELIIISKPDKSSNHTISNEWGAFKLAQCTNTLFIINNNALVKDKSKTLYFKYLCLKDNVDFFATQSDEPIKIDCEDKNVLLIDDQADKGWEDIFKIILDTNNFTSAPISFLDNGKKDENKIFNDAENLITTNEYDVILLDLRLKSSDKSNIAGFNDITNFSGYQLLKKIKEKNKGIQVIIFTASNKAWNMKALLEAGADGYYIKQSPDFYYGENYAKDNFEAFHEEMKIAIERSDFLKWFWKHTDELIKCLTVEYSSISTDFIRSVKLSLEYAYDTIENYHTSEDDVNQKYLNYTFVSYCNLIEFITSELISETISHGNKFNYKLKSTNPTTTSIDIIIYSGSDDYTSKLEFIKPVNNAVEYYIKQNATLSATKLNKNYKNAFGLKPLCAFSSIILLRYSGFVNADIQNYEIIKEKRHKFMHSNENQPSNISLSDCKEIFKMVYAVLKGGRI